VPVPPPDPHFDLRRRFPDMRPDDWTIPPEMPVSQPVRSDRARAQVDGLLQTARLLCGISLLGTAITLGTWMSNGALPAAHPSLGVTMLFVHIGVLILAARSLRAMSEAWKAARDLPVAQRPNRRAPAMIALALCNDVVLLLHAAMVVAAILA